MSFQEHGYQMAQNDAIRRQRAGNPVVSGGALNAYRVKNDIPPPPAAMRPPARNGINSQMSPGMAQNHASMEESMRRMRR